MLLILHVVLLLPAIITALPTHAGSAALSASFSGAATKPLISFDNGGIGVNFAGYHASAGLGGLLTGNAADGGLHAEAGTPHGQSAGAGLGGAVDGSGRTAGGLYAGATAGGGVSAGAGLAGSTSGSGSVGGSYAGASSGGVETHVTKISHKAPIVSASTIIKTNPIVNKEVEIIEEQSKPVVHKQVEIVEEQPKPQTTYIERTVIPNYVEKTIQVPSYVEKTIRVPTTIEKRIRVPAEPTVIEKRVEAPPKVEAEIPVTYVQKTRVHHPHVHSRIRYKTVSHGGGGYGGGGFAGGFGGGYAGGFGGGYGGGFGGSGGGGSATYTVSKTANNRLFDDIFNIPISTLGAVNKLVNGIASGVGGSFAVSKSFGVGGGASY